MSSARLDSLPLEVLQEIASLVYDFKDCSLSSFNSINRNCSAAASKFSFRDITITFTTSHEAYGLPEYDTALHETEARKWLEILRLRDAFKHVRRLHIQQYTAENPHQRELVETLLGRHEHTRLSRAVIRREFDQRYVSGYRHVFGRDSGDEDFDISATDDATEQSDDRDWTQTCKLVASLNRLTDLTTDLDYVRFPAALLETLHRDQPQCRLSLRWPVGACLPTNPRQLAIAASPCLHKITWARTRRFGANFPHLDFSAAAANGLLRVVTAPNIKHIDWDRGDIRSLEDFETATPLESGLLESLTLTGRRFDQRFLQIWQNTTDFSLLRHIKFGGGLTKDALLFVASEPHGSPLFPCLESLEIFMQFDTTPLTPLLTGRADKRRNEMNAFTRFFTDLTPLKSLKLTGEMNRGILLSAVKRHGCKLRELIIMPQLNMYKTDSDTGYNPCIRLHKDDIHQIHKLAPSLQALTIPIPRTKSDGPELEMYQALSQCKGIRNLRILLDCSMPWVVNHQDEFCLIDKHDGQLWCYPTEDAFYPTEDASFGSFENELCDPENVWGPGCPRRGHIRDNLLNAAVDENLASSIWDVLKSGPLGNTLNHLTLLTIGVGHFGPGKPVDAWDAPWPKCELGIAEYYRYMGSCFEIDACWTEGPQVSRSIREIGREGRLAATKELVFLLESRLSARESDDNSIADSSDAFHRTWKRNPTRTSKTWLDEVESIPLQADTISNISLWLRETKLGYLRYDDPFY